RELRNVLERACSFWDGLRLTGEAVAAALPPGQERLPEGMAPQQRLPDEPSDSMFGAAAGRAAEASPAPPQQGGSVEAGAHVAADSVSLPEQIARLARAAIAAALRACGGNRAQAARRLGIARATLYQKLAAWPDLAADGGGEAPAPLSRDGPH